MVDSILVRKNYTTNKQNLGTSSNWVIPKYVSHRLSDWSDTRKSVRSHWPNIIPNDRPKWEWPLSVRTHNSDIHRPKMRKRTRVSHISCVTWTAIPWVCVRVYVDVVSSSSVGSLLASEPRFSLDCRLTRIADDTCDHQHHIIISTTTPHRLRDRLRRCECTAFDNHQRTKTHTSPRSCCSFSSAFRSQFIKNNIHTNTHKHTNRHTSVQYNWLWSGVIN